MPAPIYLPQQPYPRQNMFTQMLPQLVMQGLAYKQADKTLAEKREYEEKRLFEQREYQEKLLGQQRRIALEDMGAEDITEQMAFPGEKTIKPWASADGRYFAEPKLKAVPVGDSGSYALMYGNQKMGVVQGDKLSLQRKTRSLDIDGKPYKQDYNFNPATGDEELVGKPYRSKDPTGSNIFLGVDPNTNKIITMSSKGPPEIKQTDAPQGVQIGPKTMQRLSGEQQKFITDLTDIERIATKVEELWKPEFTGPVQGPLNIAQSTITNKPKFTEFRNTAAQLRSIVYGLSGKQINQAELEWLKKEILPSMMSPDENYQAALKVLKEWVQAKRDESVKNFAAQKYIVGDEGKTVTKGALEDPAGIRE